MCQQTGDAAVIPGNHRIANPLRRLRFFALRSEHVRNLILAATFCGLTIVVAACGHTTTERAATGAVAGAVVAGPPGAGDGAAAGAVVSKAAGE